MDTFTIIYKILKTLESAMELEEFDKNDISAEKLSKYPNQREFLLDKDCKYKVQYIIGKEIYVEVV